MQNLSAKLTSEDFDVLSNLIAWFGRPVCATPQVLSQVSDLIDLEGEERMEVRRRFRVVLVETIDEALQERGIDALNFIHARFFDLF